MHPIYWTCTNRLRNKVDIDVKDWKSAIYSVQLCYKDRVIANKVFNIAR